MKIRLLDLEYPEDPHLSLATDEAIFDLVIKGRSPPTLRFYRHKNAIILGCFQLAQEEIDMDFAKANNIIIAKRFTGGGAVYHDLGDLNYSIIMKDSHKIGLNVTKLFSLMINGALSSFKVMGIDAQSGKLNDVTVNGKKVLGAAASIRSDAVLFHAAMLVNTNLNMLASSLKIPGIKLKDKGIKTILDRVTNIYDISGKNVEDVKKALLQGYSSTFGFEYVDGQLTKEEEELAGKLRREKYTKSEWTHGREIIVIP